MTNTYRDINLATYDQIASDYIKRDQGIIPETCEVNTSIESFISQLPKNAEVLDVGCGGGRDARRFAAASLTVTAIDISEKMLEASKALDPQQSIRFLQMDMEHMSFPTESFDGIWANASLHHIPKDNLSAVLRALYDFLKPGGIVQIKVHKGTTEGVVSEQKFDQPVRRYFAKYVPDELSKILKETGFEPVSIVLATGEKWIDCLSQKPRTENQ